MKHPLLCFVSLFISFYSSSCVPGFGIRPAARSLKSFSSHTEDSAELVALLNGTIYLEDRNSGKVFWSFSSGSPIYSSYQHHTHLHHDHDDASGPTTGFFVDYGDDWQLYAHAKRSTGMKLSMNIEDFIKITPHISEDGAVILGSKTTTVFVVEAKTGNLARTYTSLHSPSDQQDNTLQGANKSDKDVAFSESSNTNQVIYITRTDYALQTFAPNSDKISWNMKVAVIEAAFLCKDSDTSTTSLNSTHEIDSETGSDFEKMLSCQSKYC